MWINKGQIQVVIFTDNFDLLIFVKKLMLSYLTI